MNKILQLKGTENIFLRAIIWYTLLISSIVVLIDTKIFFQLLTWGTLGMNFQIVFYLLLESAFLIVTIYTLKRQHVKYFILLILFYWIAQIFVFGIMGKIYCFITGPGMTIYFTYLEKFQWGYLFKFWNQEFTIRLNNHSNQIYLGLNLLPLILSGSLIYLIKRPGIPD